MNRVTTRLMAGLAFAAVLVPAPAMAADSASRAASNVVPADGRSKVSGLIAAGGSYRWLYGIPIRGLEMAAGLGHRDDSMRAFNAYVVPRFFIGATRAGLDVHQLTVGARGEWRFGGFAYAGANLTAGMLWIGRAKQGAMSEVTGSASLFLGPELILSEHTAAGINVTGTAEYSPGTDPALLLGSGLEVRVRFF